MGSAYEDWHKPGCDSLLSFLGVEKAMFQSSKIWMLLFSCFQAYDTILFTFKINNCLFVLL